MAESLETRILPAVTFGADTYHFTMVDGVMPEAAIGAVSADDSEGYGAMYWVEDSPTWDFYIDYEGSLYFSATPDCEQASSYTLIVGATNGNYTDYATVVVDILRVDDETPIFDQASYSVTRPEDESIQPGTALTTVAASDLDTDAGDLTYTLLTTGTPFSVSANGAVLIDGPLDYEAGSMYELEIQVEDLGGHTATTWLTVNVTDVDDEAPTVSGPLSFSIGDNSDPGAWVGTLDAWDADTDPNNLTFTIVGGDDFHDFDIDECGSIYLYRAVDYDVVPSYDLTVEVSDGVNTTTVTVHIDVLFENYAPEITEFSAVCIGGSDGMNEYWTFTGHVEDDERPYLLEVWFGGLIDGEVTTVEYDGTFSITLELPIGASGVATAKFIDRHGLESTIAECYVG